MGEPVAGADDEGVEGVLRVQPGAAIAILVGVLGSVGGRRRQRDRLVLPVVVIDRGVAGGRLVRLVRVDGDSDPDVSTEFLGEDGRDERAEPVLEIVLGEVVRRGEQGGVLDQAERPGEADPRLLLRTDRRIIETGPNPVPDGHEFGAVVH
jgi:hypothetical protein